VFIHGRSSSDRPSFIAAPKAPSTVLQSNTWIRSQITPPSSAARPAFVPAPPSSGATKDTGTASSAARAAEADAADSFELFIGNTDSRYAPRPWNYARRAGAAGLRGADAQPRREDRRDGAGRRARHPPAAHRQEFAATVRDEHGRPLMLQNGDLGRRRAAV
jgi:hypothetical protein